MARLTRKNIKVFAGDASNNGVFGSLQANNPVSTNDVEQIQSLSAWDEGWNAATETSEDLPPLEELQGIEYVTTYQQAYIMQEGLPEWAATVSYYKGSLVKEVTANGFRIYCSLTDDNIGNIIADTANWKKVMDSEDLYAFDNAVVHKAGAETITGEKTFSVSPIVPTATAGDSSTKAASTEFVTTVASSLQTQVNTKANTSDVVKLTGSQTIAGTKTFSSSPVVPTASSSDSSTKSASTAFVKNVLSSSGSGLATFVKATNAYLKFSNGFIIQKGRVTGITSQGEKTVTFPTPFSSASSYAIVKNYETSHSTTTYDREVSFYSMTATSAKTYQDDEDSTSFSWIAFGY